MNSLFCALFIIIFILSITGLIFTLIESQYRNLFWIPLISTILLSIPFITGISPNFQKGKSIFIVKDNWEGGITFKSYDSHLRYDNDNMTPLFVFSTQDPKLANIFKENLGKKVEITYRTWFIAPIKLSSSNEPLEVTPIDSLK